MADTLALRGILKGHNGWVTSIATSSVNPDMVVSGSRDNTIMQWKITREDTSELTRYGYPQRSITGHSDTVQDVAISSDGQFALSCSWDKELRLWDLQTGKTARRFVGHTKDVLSVAFSPENRQIVSGSRDNTIKLWNTLGQCKFTIEEDGHTDWVSCVRFSQGSAERPPVIVTGGWDKRVNVWNLSNCKLVSSFTGHTGYITTVTISPDSSLCASGGKDGTVMLWDLKEEKKLYSLEAGSLIHSLVFSPNRYWLCAATDAGIKIWDLESKTVVAELNRNYPDFFIGQPPCKPSNPACISLAWSADGSTLYSGYTDDLIRVWEVRN